MTLPDGATLAAERTQLARVRTVVVLILTAALVGRAALDRFPSAALVCLAVALIGVALAARLGRVPVGATRAAALAGATVVLAVAGILTAVA